ncbi:hypothetical protein [Pseudorhodoferax sp.]
MNDMDAAMKEPGSPTTKPGQASAFSCISELGGSGARNLEQIGAGKAV